MGGQRRWDRSHSDRPRDETVCRAEPAGGQRQRPVACSTECGQFGTGNEEGLAMKCCMALVFFQLATAELLAAQGETPPMLRGVGLDQRLNEQVPLELTFCDESGKTVRLGDFFEGKPVILVLAYYRCPM